MGGSTHTHVHVQARRRRYSRGLVLSAPELAAGAERTAAVTITPLGSQISIETSLRAATPEKSHNTSALIYKLNCNSNMNIC